MPDLYELLALSKDASSEDIKRAYRRQARRHHPDAGGDEESFKEITHAYRILSDPESKARYDRFGDDGTPSTRGNGDPFGFGGAGFGNVNDVIDAFFGSAFGGQARGGPTRRNAPGRDVLVGVEISLEEVVTGVRREVEIDVAVACDFCGGSGSASGSGSSRCPTCGGAGQVQRIVRTAFGQLASAATCDNCQGTGRSIQDPCSSCHGEGRRAEQRTITVDVPAGVGDGNRLRITGAGEAGRQGADAGDLFVEVHVEPHEIFEREDRELYAEVTVPVTQAVLGGSMTVPTIDGEEVEVPVPAGTQPGDVLNVRRAGIPATGGGRRGDLHLVVRVEVPTDLDDEQRDLMRSFADARGEALASGGRGLFTRLKSAFRS